MRTDRQSTVGRFAAAMFVLSAIGAAAQAVSGHHSTVIRLLCALIAGASAVCAGRVWRSSAASASQ